MFHKLSLSLFLLILLSSPGVVWGNDNATVFPPVTMQNTECGGDQLRVVSWAKGTTSTICLTGQEVMSLALASCSADQQVVYDGSKFVCRSPVAIPTCSDGQYLSYDGGAYHCKATVTPNCADNEVLTSTSSGFTCVQRTNGIPTCSGNEVLTFNGSVYQCANNSTITIPTCATNQRLTGQNNSLVCVDNDTSGGSAGCGSHRDQDVYRVGSRAYGHHGCQYTYYQTFQCQNGAEVFISDDDSQHCN